jgi:hypothetical protein
MRWPFTSMRNCEPVVVRVAPKKWTRMRGRMADDLEIPSLGSRAGCAIGGKMPTRRDELF